MNDTRTYDDLAAALRAMPYESRELTLTLMQIAIFELSASWTLVFGGDAGEFADEIVRNLAEHFDTIAEQKIADGPPLMYGRDFTLAERHGAGEEPRTWNDLRDVPVVVTQVRDEDGDLYRRSDNAACKWEIRPHRNHDEWDEIPAVLLTQHAPFTEVIADA